MNQFGESILKYILVFAAGAVLFSFARGKTDLSETCHMFKGTYDSVTRTCALPSATTKEASAEKSKALGAAVLCESNSYLAGLREDGQAVCRPFEQGTAKGGGFVGGYILQENCILENGKMNASCKGNIENYKACNADNRPFVIRANNIEYQLPNLCFEAGEQCHVESSFGPAKRISFLKCEKYNLKAFALNKDAVGIFNVKPAKK